MSSPNQDAARERPKGVISLLASGLRQGFLDAYTGNSLKAFFLFHLRIVTLLIFLSLALLIVASTGAAAWQAALNGSSPNRFSEYAPADAAEHSWDQFADAVAEATDAASTADAAADAAAEAAAAAAAVGEPTGGRFHIIEPAPSPPCPHGTNDCEPWERVWNTDQ